MSDQETATTPAGPRRRIETAEAVYKYAIEKAARIAEREAEMCAALADHPEADSAHLKVQEETARHIAAAIRTRSRR